MTAATGLSGRLLRQANIADGLILAPFAVPFVAGHYLNFWSWLDIVIGGSGLAEFASDQLVFVNLAGAFALFGIVLRHRHPDIATARAVGVFKLCAVAIFGSALAMGAARVFAIPMAADLIVGLLLCLTNQSTNKPIETI